MVKKILSSFSDLQTTILHQIRFCNIYLVLNKYIPAFARTVDDLNKMHPALTVSTCNTDGFSVLVPGTKVNQRESNKVIQMGPGQGTGLSYKTNFVLKSKYRFIVSGETMRNREEVILKGRATPSKISELQYKLYNKGK